MATQSRAGANKRQGKGAGRAGAARRRAQATRNNAVSDATTTAGSGSGAVAVEPRRQDRPSANGGGESARAARKQQTTTASEGRFSGRTEGIRKVIADTRAELRRVSWPDKETTQNLTLVVIAISVALGILLGGIDFVLFRIFEAIT